MQSTLTYLPNTMPDCYRKWLPSIMEPSIFSVTVSYGILQVAGLMMRLNKAETCQVHSDVFLPSLLLASIKESIGVKISYICQEILHKQKNNISVFN